MRPLKLSQKPFCIGFPGAMKCQTIRLSCAQAMLRSHSLDRLRLEFPACFHGDGLVAPPEFCNEIGGLLPIAPCGRTSL